MRSGAGRETSGALHHSYVNGLEAEGEGFWNNAFDAENAIPENAYLSQMIVVPDSSRDLIRELQTTTETKGERDGHIVDCGYDTLAAEVTGLLTRSPSGLQRIVDGSYDHPCPIENVDTNLSAAQSVWTCLRHKSKGYFGISTFKT